MPDNPLDTQPEKKGIVPYTLEYFYCPLTLKDQCDQEVPSNRVITVMSSGSDMQTYSSAFELAKQNAPFCAIHGIQMVPQLIKAIDDDAPED